MDSVYIFGLLLMLFSTSALCQISIPGSTAQLQPQNPQNQKLTQASNPIFVGPFGMKQNAYPQNPNKLQSQLLAQLPAEFFRAAAPSPARGPLANLAASPSFSNFNRSPNRAANNQAGAFGGLGPLGLMALGGGGSDAFLPMMLMQQNGMMQNNPMLGLFFMSTVI